MGAWGGGLYDSDFGRDLRHDIKGYLRAPIADEEILRELAAAYPSEGDGHVDACDFWLVLADQLERRGLHRPDVFDRAERIIEGGEDVVALERLDASPDTLTARRKVGAELLRRLRNPRPAKPRRPLKKPQPLLFEAGEAIAWPTDKGQFKSPMVPGGFKQDGWGFGIVSDAGHLYGVIAYCAVQTLKWRRPDKPSADLAAQCARSERHYGNITARDIEELGIERLGRVSDEALGPPIHPTADPRERRQAALEGGLPKAFGWDAFNHAVWPGPKFMFAAPLEGPNADDGLDQRAGMFEEDNEFDPLPCDKPATRAHYFNVMRAQAGLS